MRATGGLVARLYVAGSGAGALGLRSAGRAGDFLPHRLCLFAGQHPVQTGCPHDRSRRSRVTPRSLESDQFRSVRNAALGGTPKVQIAREHGISRSTLYRYLQHP